MTAPVWRVLGDGYEAWHPVAHLAFLDARAMEAARVADVEVNRVVLRPKASKFDLLNRTGIVESSEIVPPETWRTAVKRVRPIGAAATQERAERDMESESA